MCRANQTLPVPLAFRMKLRKMKSRRKGLGSAESAGGQDADLAMGAGPSCSGQQQEHLHLKGCPGPGVTGRAAGSRVHPTAHRQWLGSHHPHPHWTIFSRHVETVQHPPCSTHGCPFHSSTEGLETCRVAAPTTHIHSEREVAGASGCRQIPRDPLPKSLLANTPGALTPVIVPHLQAPTWGRGRQLQPHKEGEQKSSVRRPRRGCAWEGGSQKAGNAAKKKVWHNGVGNENFALGFPRAHPKGKIRGRGE